ncbi:2-aminomuconic semialdehyde dehydrogenase isoform X7 [Macaca fascicularis]|uniref:2-aminomuconic semialdehyde dehydrogenase isoform X7 n=1 Tax=Macaca fascicularis TaxID=9541 RepID=UPI003D15696D
MAGTKALLMLENFIDGKFLPCSSYIDSYDPSTGEVYCRVPNSGKDEIEAAVKAAREAFPGWSSRSPQERSRVLNQVADLLEQSLEEFAQAESKDQGKTLALARTMDIPRSVQNFRFFASSILHHTSECTQMDHLGCMHYTVRAPVGVAGLISPWNLPLYLLTWKIAPAIAAGNTVVAKPSELTSVTAWMLCTLLDKAGFPHPASCLQCQKGATAGVPPGVVNIVFGTGPRVGEALVSHPEVPLISFTGSQPTAERITQLSAPHCKKLSLELGGKNPAIIFEDANLDECIPATVRSSFANQGEICLCTSRIFVQKSIYTEFLKRFVEATRKWKVGIPSDPLASMGALISKAHLEKLNLPTGLWVHRQWSAECPVRPIAVDGPARSEDFPGQKLRQESSC